MHICFRAVNDCYSTLFNLDDSFNLSKYKHYQENANHSKLSLPDVVEWVELSNKLSSNE